MIDRERLLATFLDLVQIDSPSGEEQAIASYIVKKLASLGVSSRIDATGNVVALLPGDGEPLLLNAHMDNVAPCRGVKPVVVGDVVRTDGTTVLGSDDKAGVSVILEALQTAVEGKLALPPLDLVFSVREETGLWGARGLDFSQLRARQGFVLDGGGPPEYVVVAAPSISTFDITVHGRAAHAGASPERGINAIRVAAEAICGFPVGRLDEDTTAAVGIIKGGTARNIVPDLVTIEAGARSHDEAKLETQSAKIRSAFETAAAKYGATIDIVADRWCDAFSIPADSPIYRRVGEALRALGKEIKSKKTGGGMDANVFNKNGIQCVGLNSGYYDNHSTAEWLNIDEFARSAELLVRAIARG